MNTGFRMEGATVAELADICVHGFRARSFAAPRNDADSYFSIQKKLFKQYWVQISPIGILFFDEADFPVSPPFLERLLTSNGVCRIIIGLEPDQTIDAVSGAEARHRVRLMLMCAAHQVACYPEIERSMPAAGKEVHVEWQLPLRGVIPGRPSGTGSEPMNTDLGTETTKSCRIV